MSRKPNSAAQNDDAIDSVAKKNAAELRSISSQDNAEVSNSNDSLVHVPLDTIPVNVSLPCTVYIKKGSKTLVFRRQGEKINYKTALEMQKRDSNTLFIHNAFWQMFTKSLDSLKIESSGSSETIKAAHMRHLLLAYGQELEKRTKEPKKPMFDKLRRLAAGISEALQKDPKLVSTFLRPSKDPLAYFVNHSVNCSVYATMMGIKLGLRSAQLNELAYATIVHDIGNLYLPKRILYKRSTLTSDEFDTVKSHCRRGAELLLGLKASPDVVKGVLQHHERMDGKGYPDGLKGEDIHIYARIIAIADVFDALTSERPATRGIPAPEAIRKMAAMDGAFDPKLLSMVEAGAASPVVKSDAA